MNQEACPTSGNVWRNILRDVALIMGLTYCVGFVAGALFRERPEILFAIVAISNCVVLLIGLTLGGFFAEIPALFHTVLVSFGVWVASYGNVLMGLVTVENWFLSTILFGVIWVLANLLVITLRVVSISMRGARALRPGRFRPYQVLLAGGVLIAFWLLFPDFKAVYGDNQELRIQRRFILNPPTQVGLFEMIGGDRAKYEDYGAGMFTVYPVYGRVATEIIGIGLSSALLFLGTAAMLREKKEPNPGGAFDQTDKGEVRGIANRNGR